ncbi:unnamed protein product [Lactuca virosa]|uniref:Uncharacterized protein n=1 Tax=Lactuca virosa TaxID=75947 RepID=A0AAU9PUA3_9ASTR|nr:unnamed protein product [Lactuca virosa]
MASKITTVSPPKTIQSQPLQLQDRVAIVTGGSRGIGKAISLHLASLGAKLVVNYTSNSSKADLVVSEINSKSQSESPQAVSFKADVSDPIQVKALFDVAESIRRKRRLERE